MVEYLAKIKLARLSESVSLQKRINRSASAGALEPNLDMTRLQKCIFIEAHHGEYVARILSLQNSDLPKYASLKCTLHMVIYPANTLSLACSRRRYRTEAHRHRSASDICASPWMCMIQKRNSFSSLLSATWPCC